MAPNLLFIMADQHRYDFVGAAGAGWVHTPNLDGLAGRGMLFTHCVANSTVCAPSRIALASGLLPVRVGAVDNAAYLPASVPTYYQRLRDHDYRVGVVGKLDLAKPDPYNGRHGDRPSVFRWGFTHPEECEGKMHAGSSPTPIGPYSWYLHERGLLQRFHEDYRGRFPGFELTADALRDSVLPADAFEDVYIGRRAVEWIERVPDDFPWHLFVSFVGPHDPFDPPAEYADRFREAPLPPPIADSLDGKPNWVKRRRHTLTPAQVTVARRQYCASTEVVDEQVGHILDALERRGLAEQTYVVYTSDHGEMLGDHGLFQKHVPYEASQRIPLIVAGPDVPGGVVSHALVELMDLNPTVCELAGLPPQGNIDARSFTHLFARTDEEHRDAVLSIERPFHCLRTRQYKFVENHNDIFELYDLEEDPAELVNRAKERPELCRELYLRMRERLQEGKWLR